MDRRERERILGVGAGPRDGNVRDQMERRALERDLGDGRHVGQEVPRRLRNFRPSVEGYVASLGGPLPYMRRLRAIEEHIDEHERRLAAARDELARECAEDAAAFARRWCVVAERWNFYEVNELIDRHNRDFPAEARLPMDPRTRDYALVAGRPYWRERLDAKWILERFPPESTAAA